MDAEIHDRDDLTDARTALERLSGLLPIELDLRRIGHVSLLPAKAAVLREVLAYRTTTLGLDAAGLIAQGRMLEGVVFPTQLGPFLLRLR